MSLKGYRQNWQETAPGEENVNQLLNTNCNKWHLNRFMKHVQKSIIQLYLQKVTLSVLPKASVISSSHKSRERTIPKKDPYWSRTMSPWHHPSSKVCESHETVEIHGIRVRDNFCLHWSGLQTMVWTYALTNPVFGERMPYGMNVCLDHPCFWWKFVLWCEHVSRINGVNVCLDHPCFWRNLPISGEVFDKSDTSGSV